MAQRGARRGGSNGSLRPKFAASFLVDTTAPASSVPDPTDFSDSDSDDDGHSLSYRLRRADSVPEGIDASSHVSLGSLRSRSAVSSLSKSDVTLSTDESGRPKASASAAQSVTKDGFETSMTDGSGPDALLRLRQTTSGIEQQDETRQTNTMKTSSTTLAFITVVLQLLQLSTAAAAGTSKTALLMIDVQNCFCEGDVTSSGEPGSLAVEDTASLIPILNSLREEKSCLFDSVVRSQDYHPPDHISFGPTHGLEPFSHLFGKGELPLLCVSPESGLMTDASCCPSYHVDPEAMDCETQLCPLTATDAVMSAPACTICKESPDECFETTQAMWTSHCLMEGDSDFPSTLMTMDNDVIVQKGTGRFVDAYSVFADNTKRLRSDLDETLKSLEIETLYFVGIAAEYCVCDSALDALELGYNVKVIEDAIRGITPETTNAALTDMKLKGAQIVTVADVMAMDCPMPPVEEPEPASVAASASSTGIAANILGAAAIVVLSILV